MYERQHMNVPYTPDTFDELGKLYHELCEAYDRKVCPGGKPISGRHHALINRHALEVRKQILDRIGRSPQTRELLQEAIIRNCPR